MKLVSRYGNDFFFFFFPGGYLCVVLDDACLGCVVVRFGFDGLRFFLVILSRVWVCVMRCKTVCYKFLACDVTCLLTRATITPPNPDPARVFSFSCVMKFRSCLMVSWMDNDALGGRVAKSIRRLSRRRRSVSSGPRRSSIQTRGSGLPRML